MPAKADAVLLASRHILQALADAETQRVAGERGGARRCRTQQVTGERGVAISLPDTAPTSYLRQRDDIVGIT